MHLNVVIHWLARSHLRIDLWLERWLIAESLYLRVVLGSIRRHWWCLGNGCFFYVFLFTLIMFYWYFIGESVGCTILIFLKGCFGDLIKLLALKVPALKTTEKTKVFRISMFLLVIYEWMRLIAIHFQDNYNNWDKENHKFIALFIIFIN